MEFILINFYIPTLIIFTSGGKQFRILKNKISSEYFNVQTILQPYVHMCFVVFSEIKSISKIMPIFPMSISYALMS